MKPRYMLDTKIGIYIAKHRPPGVEARFERMKPADMVMSAVTYGELCDGANKSNQRAMAAGRLDALTQDIPVESFDASASRAYGEIRAEVEAQGRTIGNNDLWIAAHAMALGVTLATNDEREFRRIAGLHVENWAK